MKIFETNLTCLFPYNLLFSENLAGVTFVYHVFENERSISGSQIDEKKSVVRKQVNSQLVRWLSLEDEKKRLIKSVINEAADPDIAFAVK